MLPLPQLHATRPFLFSCAETDLNVCERGQTACPEERNPWKGPRNGQSSAEVGGTEDSHPTHPFPFIASETTSGQHKISLKPLCLSVLGHPCCYYLLNSEALTSHAGTLGGGKIRDDCAKWGSNKHQHKEALTH